MRTTLGFFNEILSYIQKLVYDDSNGITRDSGVDSKYYYLPVEDYFSMCMRVSQELHISPKEVYEDWGLPMLLVTYVYLHNHNVTDYGYQQDSMRSNKPPVVHYEENYIRNITPDMVAEQFTTEEQSTDFPPEQEILRSLYGRTT